MKSANFFVFLHFFYIANCIFLSGFYLDETLLKTKKKGERVRQGRGYASSTLYSAMAAEASDGSGGGEAPFLWYLGDIGEEVELGKIWLA